MNAARPVSILIAALGGEGGGVLADWIVAAANEHDFPVQSTSVPGVAQRTGATTYYLEIFPVARAALNGVEPVLSLTPNPGNVDIVAASELIEAGRVLQAGYVAAARTTVIASTHRIYAVSEKAAMGDGRYDTSRIQATAQRLARRTVFFDMAALASKHGTVINTVIFGAMFASGSLSLSREACENAIRASGKAVEASLRGFESGIAYVESQVGEPGQEQGQEPAQKAAPPDGAQPNRGGPRRRSMSMSMPERIAALPEALHEIVLAGADQLIDYQGRAYVERYLDRVESLLAVERQHGGEQGNYSVTLDLARYLALWMSYEDVIRVADLKTRRARLERVRSEVGAKDGEPLKLTEYLKPGLDEICSILPPRPAAWLRRRLAGRSGNLHMGLHIRTNTIGGFLLLCGLRSLRPWRPRTSRFAVEQRMIEHWIVTVKEALPRDAKLAHELALCGNLVKGYGETSERGHHNLDAILLDAKHSSLDVSALTERIAAARRAALSDPEGKGLDTVLGLPPRAPVSKPIHFVRKKALS